MTRQDSRILSLADLIPNHNLKGVCEVKKFDTWAVDYKPDTWPQTLWMGDGSLDFNVKCWPFMAAHEALHSISTDYTLLDDYQFLLYNICEDWRMNSCLLGIFGELNESYDAMRAVILKRWQSKPLQLKSPLSIALQHLCYLNFVISPKIVIPDSAEDYFLEMTHLRSEFAKESNWPIIQDQPDRPRINREKSLELLDKIKAKKAPNKINVGDIKNLIRRMGYDIDTFPKNEMESNSKAVHGKVQIQALAPTNQPVILTPLLDFDPEPQVVLNISNDS